MAEDWEDVSAYIDEIYEEQRQADLANRNIAIKNVELTPQHRELITFIEQYWYVNKCYPSVAAFSAYAKEVGLLVTELKSLELELILYLQARGISPSKASSRLSEEQLAAVNLILNFSDRRSTPVKLKSIGVTPTKWEAWKRSKPFAEYLKNRSGEMLEGNMHEAHTGLLKGVERGDNAALKLYYEITGVYKQDSPVANVNIILSQVLEVIQREIRDPETLKRIAAGFEMVMLRSSMATVAPSSLEQRPMVINEDGSVQAYDLSDYKKPEPAPVAKAPREAVIKKPEENPFDF